MKSFSKLISIERDIIFPFREILEISDQDESKKLFGETRKQESARHLAGIAETAARSARYELEDVSRRLSRRYRLARLWEEKFLQEVETIHRWCFTRLQPAGLSSITLGGDPPAR